MRTPDSPFTGDTTSGSNTTPWISSADQPVFEKLQEPLQTDVLIIGGGIAGLTTAYCLLQTGRKVTVVEDGFIGSGETGRTTAHLTYSLGDRYSDLEQEFGVQKARKIMESHRAAIDWIRDTVERERIACHLKTVDGYLFAHPSDTDETLDKELGAMQQIGAPVTLQTSIPGFKDGHHQRCLAFPGQAQFHPMLYLQGLTDAILRMGGAIYTQSHAADISAKGARVNGFEVSANHIVVAANTAINNLVRLHTKQWPYRTYAIAIRVPKDSIRPALWWDTGDQESIWMAQPYHYVRTEPESDAFDLLIVGGEDHRTGQEAKEEITQDERYARLRAWAEQHFDDLGDTVAHWSGQTLYAVDGISFIGRNPGDRNIYIITADCGNGMTSSTIGGMLITDLINGNENGWEEVYDPSRNVFKSAPGDYLHEIGNMTAQYTDWLTSGDDVDPEQLQRGQGAVVSRGLKKLAVYRDEKGVLHTCSAVCPHLGAIVHWNEGERSFDCPAHGSRFTGEGKAINGPAIGDLEAQRDKEKTARTEDRSRQKSMNSDVRSSPEPGKSTDRDSERTRRNDTNKRL